MTFGKRLRFYLIGFVLGTIISVLFFKGRGCGWLPENRVLLRLTKSYILANDSMRCVLKCNHIDSLNIKDLFKNGNVLFSESRPNDEPKMYVIECKLNNNEKIKIGLLLNDSLVTLNHYYNNKRDCIDCNAGNSVPYLFALPDRD
jgi:hypothetical protein